MTTRTSGGPGPVPEAAGPDPGTTTAPGAEIAEPPASQATGAVPRNASADRAAVRAFRPRRVIPSVITALLMTALGLLVALEVVSALLNRPLRLVPYDRILPWASSTPWSDPRVMAGAGLTGLLGLLLVLLAIVPGRPTLVPVRTGTRKLLVGVQRRGFARSLARAAEAVPGVDRARVRLLGRTVRVRADAGTRDVTDLGDVVREAVNARIDAFSPVRRHSVRVRLRGR
ncbi:DUF6286 domain-containing protein [Streptosporangium sp. NPDC050855]|uniref:DUF6286 domain-containing protein n=1 Tax=Streptosporangium sp. NPDC050855 TaxID=3366194 RepID=UPI0037931676